MSMEPWQTFFPFGANTRYTVDGPLTFNGDGETLVNTGPVLQFTMNMPALALKIKLTYVKEGDGNEGEVEVNGKTYSDTNLHISSDIARRRRRIVPSISMPEVNLQLLEFGPDSANEIDMDMTINGKSHDFDLERM